MFGGVNWRYAGTKAGNFRTRSSGPGLARPICPETALWVYASQLGRGQGTDSAYRW
jgi:hypothetical protein